MDRLTGKDVHRLCSDNRWFTVGTNQQYARLIEEVDDRMETHDIAVAIWICSDAIALENIEGKIKDYLRWERPQGGGNERDGEKWSAREAHIG